MAGQVGTTTAGLTFEEALEREPYRFDFFQALRRLECLYAQKPRLGRGARSADDPVRLGEDAHLEFAPRTVASYSKPPELPPRLSVYFFGLFGPAPEA
ncbi:MAG: type VI secretion system baseplate subunit TssG, partial [Deltaproteobacteria bacterium]|nr:type VI secretion system baseplate subunit TssG [Deltaproteobacteria bacterium]